MSWLRRREEAIVLGSFGLLVGVTTLLPLLFLAFELVRAGRDGVRTALSALVTPATSILLLRSVAVAAATTALALLAGVPLAVLFSRTRVFGRRAVFFLHTFPMFLPPFLLALGWFYLLGRGGLLGTDATDRLLFSAPAVVFILALAFTPVVTALVGLGLDGVDPSLEDAARVVAGPWRVVTRILLPLARPAIAAATLVVFALALTEIGVPMFLRVPVYPAAVFARLGGIAYSPGEAFALVIPLLAVSGILVAYERRLVFRRSFASLALSPLDRPPVLLGRCRALGTSAAWIAAALAVFPILSLAIRAGVAGILEAPGWAGRSIANSLASAASAATVLAVTGLVLGHGVARRRASAAACDGLAVLGFVTPAAVLGAGLIALWNRPRMNAVYGTLLIVIVGHVARYAIVGLRTVAAAVAQTSPHVEEAAAAFGASYLRRLLRIVLPMHARAVLVAWLLVAVFSLRDLEATILFYPPGGETLPVRIFTLEANGPTKIVAGLAVVHVILTAAVLLIGTALVSRWRRS